jgi:hypothetical protein
MNCPRCDRPMFWIDGDPDAATPGWWTCEHCVVHVQPPPAEITAQEAMRAAGARELFGGTD